MQGCQICLVQHAETGKFTKSTQIIPNIREIGRWSSKMNQNWDFWYAKIGII
jgi:hypothetical protein